MKRSWIRLVVSLCGLCSPAMLATAAEPAGNLLANGDFEFAEPKWMSHDLYFRSKLDSPLYGRMLKPLPIEVPAKVVQIKPRGKKATLPLTIPALCQAGPGTRNLAPSTSQEGRTPSQPAGTDHCRTRAEHHYGCPPNAATGRTRPGCPES